MGEGMVLFWYCWVYQSSEIKSQHKSRAVRKIRHPGAPIGIFIYRLGLNLFQDFLTHDAEEMNDLCVGSGGLDRRIRIAYVVGSLGHRWLAMPTGACSLNYLPTRLSPC